jgi:hypothetical protein
MKHINFNVKQDRGFALLEVVLAIAVFAFGMLALVELQTSLARSGSDANTRTVAANIAEELVELARGFTQLDAIAEGLGMQYNEIVSEDKTETRAGLDYTRSLIVTDYYWDSDSASFTDTQPAGIVNSDLKTMDIVVAWRPLESGESFDDHDSINFEDGGAIRIVEIVSSQPSLLGALVSAAKDPNDGPLVAYNPGENPDVIRLTLDGTEGKFKEATSPTPDVIRDDKVETWFDVVTYSQIGDNEDTAIFLRREEFVAISCECDLETSPADADQGLPPTLWNGVTYSEGDPVDKPIGMAPTGVQQSGYCSVCCRDHHDGAGDGAEKVYDVANSGNGGSDHGHYTIDRRGVIDPIPVGDGDRYIEACRMIRKDGFMRVTHDANQGALIGFPEGYLEFDGGAEIYSEYLIDAIGDYYAIPTGNNPPLAQPAVGVFPARQANGSDATDLPTATFAPSQQMRSRAIYTDYLTSAAILVIQACFDNQGDPTGSEDCKDPSATTPLELYPFFDLQMTWLARWNNITLDGSRLISVSNQAIQSDNSHSRGFAELIGDAHNLQEVEIRSHKGNPGLSATGPIDPFYDQNSAMEHLFVDANGGDAEPVYGTLVSGPLSSTQRRKPAADLVLDSGDAICGQTDTSWACVTDGGGSLSVSNYYLNNPTMSICSDLVYAGVSDDNGGTTLFALPASGTGLRIWATHDPTDPVCHPNN